MTDKEPEPKPEEIAENSENKTEAKTETKKKKKPKKDEGTAWWEYALIIAVLSYKIYTPLPDDIEDRYARSANIFFQKAVFKVGHYIRIISPNSEIAYVRAATNGIASLRRDVEGVTETVTDIGNLNVHIFTPEGSPSKSAIYYIHGGNWLMGAFPWYSTYLKNMAKETGSKIIAPDYRLAPENAFPVPFDDCMEGMEYLFKNAESLNVDPGNVVLAGDSTGATMALAASLTMTEKKFKSVSLFNPMTQNLLWTLPSHLLSRYFSLSDAGLAWGMSNYVNGENGQKHREYLKGAAYLQAKKKHKVQFALLDPFQYFEETEMKNPDGKNWNAPAGDFMAQEIPDWVPASAKKMVDFRVAPLFASEEIIGGSSETHFFISEYDILRDEANMMVKRFEKAKVKVSATTLKGAFHNEFFLSKYFFGYDLMIPSADENTRAYFAHLKKLGA